MAKCLLCNSSKEDDVEYGKMRKKYGVSVHEFCLYLSSGLVQNGEDHEGILGFLIPDIKKESARAEKLFCFYCRKRYASIGCCETKCHRSFHLACGLEHGAINQFVGSFRSFCNRHIQHVQKVKPPPNEICCICYDKLLDPNRKFYYTNSIKAPCCKSGWFHKKCLQGFAKSAGYFFKCPLCNDTEKFREKTPYQGIFIPSSDAAWELEPNAFSELLQRPNKCEAENCKHRKGRKSYDDENNPLICCELCGAVAMHKLCLPNDTESFQCVDCQEIAPLRPTASEGDSGRESMQAGNDDDEDVDVCYISDSDDDMVTVNVELDDEDTDEDFDIQPFSKKSKSQRFFYESSSDEIPSVKRNTTRGSSEDSECSFIAKFNRKRKIIDELDDSYKTNETCSPHYKNYNDLEGDDEDDDPLHIIAREIEKRRRIQGDNGKEYTSTSKVSSSNQTVFDTQPHSSSTALDTSKVDREAKRNFNERTLLEKKNCLHKQYISRNTTSLIENTANKANNLYSSDTGYFSTVESDEKKSTLDTSCIAKRTRHRKSINSKQDEKPTSEHNVSVDLKDKENKRKKMRNSSSNSSSECSSNAYEENETNSLEISCIANRTRGRKSLRYTENILPPICEISTSESCETYYTPTANTTSKHRRSGKVNCSEDNGSSNDSSTASTSPFFRPRKCLQYRHKERLRLISLTTDEELDENDAMKNR